MSRTQLRHQFDLTAFTVCLEFRIRPVFLMEKKSQQYWELIAIFVSKKLFFKSQLYLRKLFERFSGSLTGFSNTSYGYQLSSDVFYCAMKSAYIPSQTSSRVPILRQEPYGKCSIFLQ